MQLTIGLKDWRRVEVDGQLANPLRAHLDHAQVPGPADRAKESETAHGLRVLDRDDVE
jgi:hypothetical protein